MVFQVTKPDRQYFSEKWEGQQNGAGDPEGEYERIGKSAQRVDQLGAARHKKENMKWGSFTVDEL